MVLNVLILEREENRSTRRKNPQSTGEINYKKLNANESPNYGRRRPDLAWLFERWEAQRTNREAARASQGVIWTVLFILRILYCDMIDRFYNTISTITKKILLSTKVTCVYPRARPMTIDVGSTNVPTVLLLRRNLNWVEGISMSRNQNIHSDYSKLLRKLGVGCAKVDRIDGLETHLNYNTSHSPVFILCFTWMWLSFLNSLMETCRILRLRSHETRRIWIWISLVHTGLDEIWQGQRSHGTEWIVALLHLCCCFKNVSSYSSSLRCKLVVKKSCTKSGLRLA